MATKKNKNELPEAAPKTPSVLIKPRVTEKAAMSASRDLPAYVFEVLPGTNKNAVVAAIKAEYKVSPIKVRMTSLPRKQVFVRGKWGMKSAIKKAVVYLAKGDKIDLA